MTLRSGTRSDIAAMQRVRLAVRENALSDSGRVTHRDYVDAVEVSGRTWVVEHDGAVVGFAAGVRSGSLWALFVEPEHEGVGHGTALHSAVVDWLWSLGHHRIWLATAAGTRAERFYRSRGWQACGTVPNGDLRLELRRPEDTEPAS